jgi:ubiquinone biosynthesis protein COQ9
MRLGAKIGEGCAAIHDALLQNLNVAMIECDEIWSYVAKKESA